jgi:uncharacterized damage-inducible protein DinB
MLAKLFEHNNWANARILKACSALSDEQLDKAPLAGSAWSIRETLVHIVESQAAYVSLLTVPPDEREFPSVPFAELRSSAAKSGEALLALAGDHGGGLRRSLDGYLIEPWVILLQAINHATDHRRQICGLLRALDVTPPNLDGWTFGEASGACTQVES